MLEPLLAVPQYAHPAVRVLVTGASRGIGASVARVFAQRCGSNLQIALLSAEKTARDVERLGALALPMKVDMEDGSALRAAIREVVHSLDGLDVLVNAEAPGTAVCIDECRGALADSCGSIVTISPPIRLSRLDWIAAHPAYTLSKYSMTLATLGAASERVRANCVWPRRVQAPSVAEAVYVVATGEYNARTLLDDDVVESGVQGGPLNDFVEDEHGW